MTRLETALYSKNPDDLVKFIEDTDSREFDLQFREVCAKGIPAEYQNLLAQVFIKSVGKFSKYP